MIFGYSVCVGAAFATRNCGCYNTMNDPTDASNTVRRIIAQAGNHRKTRYLELTYS